MTSPASREPLLGPVDLCSVKFPGPCIRCAPCRGGGICEEAELWHPAIERLDGILMGGESGPDARPMHPDWARSLRDQCRTHSLRGELGACSIPFFFKQWGEWAPRWHFLGPLPRCSACESLDLEGRWWPNRTPELDGSAVMVRVGRRRAGRLLDGREWNELPIPRPTACE